MQSLMGIINLNENEELIREITRHRPLAAVPFGGRYRLIDFVLSSMVNSGVKNVGILMQRKYRSLVDHLRSGKEWDLARKRDGLFLLPPSTSAYGASYYRGDIENFYENLDYIENSPQKYVLLTGSNVVCNANYTKAFQFHQAKQADITILYKELERDNDDFTQGTTLGFDADGRVTDILVNPSKVSGKVSLGMYFLNKNVLIDIIRDCNSRGASSLVKDGFIRNINKLAIYAYPYKGYMANIYSIASYYRHSLELLKADKWQELFEKAGPVYTKIKDEPPVKYQQSAQVSSVMSANGCVIAGKVENSILFRGVTVHPGAYVRNSIIMQKCEIGTDAVVENVICDKNVYISAGKKLRGENNYPLVIEKGTIV